MSFITRKLRKSEGGRVVVDVFDWYPSHYPAAERKLLRKLDASILVFASLSFFCKFLDQSNITNAYVSGMKEDIGADGNALNYFNVAFYTAYVIGQIPMMTLQTKPALAPYLLPTLEVIWAILTFAQSRVTTPWHLYLLRALVGFFEAPSFGGTHLILGSWYLNEELFKRAGVWFMGNSLGSMFSGYLQAAAYTGLNGVQGLAGWRWLFVIDGVITLPIALIGYTFFPGLPNSPKRWFLTEEEHELARSRIPKKQNDNGITWRTFKDTLRKPMWWICVSGYVCMIQSSYWTGYMALWLKAENKYSISLINILPTFINLVQATSSWLGTTLAGSVSTWKMWCFPNFWMLFATICLSIWTIPDGLKFLAFYVGGFSGMSSPILYSWINATLRDSTAERGLIISSMMTAGYCTYIWVPLFTFATVDSPRFSKGYPASVAFVFGLWAIIIFGMWYMARKQRNEGDVEGKEIDIGRRESGTNTIYDGERNKSSLDGSTDEKNGTTMPVEGGEQVLPVVLVDKAQ